MPYVTFLLSPKDELCVISCENFSSEIKILSNTEKYFIRLMSLGMNYVSRGPHHSIRAKPSSLCAGVGGILAN